MSKKPPKSQPNSALQRFIDVFYARDTVIAPARFASPPPKSGTVLRQLEESGPLVERDDWVRTARCAEIAAEIFESLPNDTPFHGPDELCTVLWSSLSRETCSQDEQPEDLCALLRSVIENSRERWRFDVRIAEVHTLQLELDIDGAQDLAVYSKRHIEVDSRSFPTLGFQTTVETTLELDVVHLRGVVVAATKDGGIIAVEQLGGTLLGGAHALGLVQVSNHDVSIAGGSSVVIAPTQDPAPTAPVPRLFEMFSGCSTVFPVDLSELEREKFAQGAPLRAVQRHLRILRDVMVAKGNHADAVRRACRLAFAAARTREYGLAMSLAFTVIEGLLLDPNSKSDTTARLAEALAHSLGGTIDERAALRTDAKKLYEERCAFIHAGGSREKAQARRHALHLMNRVLRREMESLSKTAPAGSAA